LTIAATVHLVTDDHGFDETWQESLVSGDGQSASFTRDLEQMPPAGTFTVSYTGAQTPNSSSLPLTATFDASGTRGDVDYQAEFMSSTVDSALQMPVAAWFPLVTDGGLDAAEAGNAEGNADDASD
jgi:histone deacetylase complex regulatory component SIN3